nr:flagellar motor switch protein FliN [uncultured Holophaga sp.]
MAIRHAEKQEQDRAMSFEHVIADVMPVIDTPFRLEILLGQTRMTIRDLLDLEPGSLVELKKSAGEPMEVLCKGRVIMRGEVTVLEDSLGLRIVEIIDPSRRI